MMEHFYTIQGEGANTGKAAYFLRIGGCDVGCVWCDVKESWDASIHPKYSMDEMMTWIKDSKTPNVVVTGGEPAMYDLQPLTNAMGELGVQRLIETSGAHMLTGDWEWICLSPKKFKQPVPEIYPIAHELKVVIYNKHDFEWAEQHAAHVGPNCQLFLQPEWSKRDAMHDLIVEYVKSNPKWRISLQTHKYLNIP